MIRYLHRAVFNREWIKVWQRNPLGAPVRRRGAILSVAGLTLAGLLAGCGRKGDPQLPSPAPARPDPNQGGEASPP